MKSVQSVLTLIVAGSLLNACTSQPVIHSPPTSSTAPAITPLPPTQPHIRATPDPVPSIVVKPAPETTPDLTSDLPPTLPASTKPIVVQGLTVAQARELLQQLLPAGIKDRNGWRNDMLGAFTGLKIPYEAPYFCAAIAIIEQESSWQSDPSVPGLGKMVWQEIEKRADKYHVPMLAIQLAMLKPSPDGRSYKTRIDALHTEKQMNAVFEDLMLDANKLGLPFELKNPIRTGGPMQVSVEFAEGHIRVWPYPYAYKGSIRQEVFSRRGGLYFGIANLLQYRVNYPHMRYRFADFNAGRYSSRNAAFQSALNVLSKQDMVLDGDLLRYNSSQTSTTQQVLLKLANKLGMSASAIERDLKQEKTEGFSQTTLYQRVFDLASDKAGRTLPQQVMPQIKLVSPKITRKLTTEWFATRVDGRYQRCMGRL